jgi:hypothetical protein
LVRAALAGAPRFHCAPIRQVVARIIPDRVATMAAERREQAESDLRGEWAVVKERWK